MNLKLREHANQIIEDTIADIQVDSVLRKALENHSFPDSIILVAIGKAAWQMAKTASDTLGDKIRRGIVVTKYEHSKGNIDNCECFEAGHPILDENSIAATNKVIECVNNLNSDDYVLFLVSGGGSALFESPLVSLSELQFINNQLLRSGASIYEINTIRKRLSSVKGGKFAALCHPAHVHAVIISDVLGNALDVIASGPSCVDNSTSEEALKIVRKYGLEVSKEVMGYLLIETPKKLNNVSHEIISSVHDLCCSCASNCEKLGYETMILSEDINGEAKEVGSFLGSIARTYANSNKKLAFIAGGESVVHLRGDGLGGRNQELVIGATSNIESLHNACIFSIGSDGTDGPTDAAGGYVDGDTLNELLEHDLSVHQILACNDAYHALEKVNGLIKTGPTGTNINDVAVVLIDNKNV
ncbi:MAG: glycerate kinase [Erysipelotrichales bacterium]|nr:glycerate kinase [Erysipelotrichales bacterium]